MSTTSTFCGISVKLSNTYNSEEYQKKIGKALGYTQEDLNKIEETFYNLPINKWRMYIDSDGNFGLVYLLNNEHEAFDLSYVISLTESDTILSQLIGKIDKGYIDKGSEYNVKFFAFLYYNGSDNPFKF